MDTGWLLFGASLVSAVAAMTWSFLMAAKVAAPRAAAKSRLLLVNILTGESEDDRTILSKVRGSLVRPEIVEATKALDARISTEIHGISAQLDAKFQAIHMPDAPDLIGLKSSLLDEFQGQLQNMATVLSEELAVEVANHVEMAIKGLKAQESNQIRAAIENMGLKGLTEEMKEIAVGQLGPQYMFAQAVAKWKPPPSIKENPTMDALLSLSQAVALQATAAAQQGIVGQLQGFQGMNLGGNGQGYQGAAYSPYER